MKLNDIYKLAIDIGIKNDLRSKKSIEKNLERIKTKYGNLSKEEKIFFDREKFSNPYLDSRIHYDNKKQVKKVMSGIDIDTGELLMAKQLGFDTVISHHPIGKALVDLGDVMHLQAEVLSQYGIPINIAENLMRMRISEVTREINPANHFKTVRAAEMLNINLINIHTPADNLVANFLKKIIERKKPEYVDEILGILGEIPEYDVAKKQGVGPVLFSGKEENRAGKIAITEITGGTEGSKDIYGKMANAGIGTIIAMHQSEDHRKEAEKSHINVVVAGHISSDSIGMNLFLDELEKAGLKITPCSGLIRHSRIKKSKKE